MSPDEMAEIGKAWGPVGVIAYLMLMAWLKRVPDSPGEHEANAIERMEERLGAKIDALQACVTTIDKRLAVTETILEERKR